MYEIVCRTGHYEAYLNGRFVVSGDTYGEVKKDLEALNLLF